MLTLMNIKIKDSNNIIINNTGLFSFAIHDHASLADLMNCSPSQLNLDWLSSSSHESAPRIKSNVAVHGADCLLEESRRFILSQYHRMKLSIIFIGESLALKRPLCSIKKWITACKVKWILSGDFDLSIIGIDCQVLGIWWYQISVPSISVKKNNSRDQSNFFLFQKLSIQKRPELKK